jgi:peptide/nickel transport system permease protein
MTKYIVKRVLLVIPIILAVAFLVMLLIDLSTKQLPGSSPFLVRYLDFVRNALHGDFGKSASNSRDVWSEMMQRYPYTLFLTLMSFAIAVIAGILLGVFSAVNQRTWKDKTAVVTSVFFVSIPDFLFSLILVRIIGVKLKLLPISGIENWRGWILPTVSLALGFTATITRQVRSSVLGVLRQEFITTARAKGLSERKVIYKHVLKNALFPIIITCGTIFGQALGGAFIAEMIFSLPGLGIYTLSAILKRDYPVIMGSVVFLSAMYSIIILIIDITFAFIDPRIRSQYISKREKLRHL